MAPRVWRGKDQQKLAEVMVNDLKNTRKNNLLAIVGESDIDILADDGKIQVKVNGVDVFHPNTGEVRSDGAEGMASWFIDTDYNEEAWATLNSDISRPFDKPESRRIAMKVINHLGDEVMKVFWV